MARRPDLAHGCLVHAEFLSPSQPRDRCQAGLWCGQLVPSPPGAQWGWGSAVAGLTSWQPWWQWLLLVAALGRPSPTAQAVWAYLPCARGGGGTCMGRICDWAEGMGLQEGKDWCLGIGWASEARIKRQDCEAVTAQGQD